ncbi:low molecular weight protein-tyrosine-phosphatase [Sphaerotilus sp.]|uniref:low molecular weight protein-tyrosine-phosphatase n=1 Tax=Sphaerotilus sp. TaxID=2093942 RepID=UPI00286DDB05|nr:low molecular weight protein-tyrosine-phosphatase [Sphaerotilus sp.]
MSAVQRVLMVCTANICRSPTAEAVLRHRVQRAGLHGRIVVDSAGTRASHEQSHPADPRSIAHAARRGYDLTALRSRPVVEADFHRFELIVPMDRTHFDHLVAQAPADTMAKVQLLMSFAPAGSGEVVPDPYYGSAPGFEHVLDLVELACDGLLEYLYSPQGAR